MKILNHPRIWIFSAVLVIINILALSMCLAEGNKEGILINVLFLVFNVIGLVGNYMLQGFRTRMQEEKKNEQRKELIRLTVGE